MEVGAAQVTLGFFMGIAFAAFAVWAYVRKNSKV